MATVDEGQIRPSQQIDPHLDQLAEVMAQLHPEVVKQILQTLNGPAPTAPTPPQQSGLPPLKAAAAAMNPQFAPLLFQQQNAPAQALYQQQQSAFEQAMAGRKEALGAGVQLAGQASREDVARMQADAKAKQDDILNQLRMLGIQVQMQNADTGRQNAATNAARVGKPPAPGYVLAYDINGNAFWTPKPTGGGAQPATLPNGAQAVNPTVADKRQSASSGLQALQDTLDELRASYMAGQQQHWQPERTMQTYAQKVPGVRGLAAGIDPSARTFQQAKDKVVLQLNKPVSGQQRLLQSEIDQLGGYVGDYNDPQSVALPRFDEMQKMLDKMKAKYGLAPGSNMPSGGTTTPAAAASSPGTIRRSNLNKLPLAEQQRAVRDGWTIIEDVNAAP